MNNLFKKIGIELKKDGGFKKKSIDKIAFLKKSSFERKNVFGYEDGRMALVEFSIDDFDIRSAVFRSKHQKRLQDTKRMIKEEKEFLLQKHGIRKSQNFEFKSGFYCFKSVEFFEYRGKFKGYIGEKHNIFMQSYCKINLDGSFLMWKHLYNSGYFAAPSGYKFVIDGGMAALLHIKSGNEYHLSASDFYNNISNIKEKLQENARKRARTEKEKALKSAALDKDISAIFRELKNNIDFITDSDSAKAGNCRAGTQAFKNIVGIDSEKINIKLLEKLYKKSKSKLTEFQKQRFLNVLIVAKGEKQ